MENVLYMVLYRVVLKIVLHSTKKWFFYCYDVKLVTIEEPFLGLYSTISCLNRSLHGEMVLHIDREVAQHRTI